LLLALIAGADRIAAVRPIVALPPGLRWEPKCGLTLVGDAAHVMPPLGVGVNLAMLDAADLAQALVTGQDWRQAVRDFEAVMLERASRIAIDCTRMFAEWFGPHSGRAVLKDMEAHRGVIPGRLQLDTHVPLRHDRFREKYRRYAALVRQSSICSAH
jgi:2-polyprenyl-6-methoxyphenol hydroxylase-like FAD-dependent oxidoreductase